MIATSASKETKERILSVIVLTCRFLLGLVFLFSGTTKAIDPMGGAVKVGEYFSAFGFADWEWLSLPFAINLAAVEFTLGTCLVLGVYSLPFLVGDVVHDTVDSLFGIEKSCG